MKALWIRIWKWFVSHKAIAALTAAAIVVVTVGAIVVIGLPKGTDKTPASVPATVTTTTTSSLSPTATGTQAEGASTTAATQTTATLENSKTTATSTAITTTTAAKTTAKATETKATSTAATTAKATTKAPTAAPTAAPTTTPTTKATTKAPTAAPTTAPTSAVPTECEEPWIGFYGEKIPCGVCDYCVNYADTMTLQEAEDFANAYLESLGFELDYTLVPEDAGYNPPFTWDKGMSFEYCEQGIITNIHQMLNEWELTPESGLKFRAYAVYSPNDFTVTYAWLYILRG